MIASNMTIGLAAGLAPQPQQQQGHHAPGRTVNGCLPTSTNITFLPELEETYRKNYVILSKMTEVLASMARDCGVQSIELTSVNDLAVRCVGLSRHGNAQAVSAVTCFLRYYRSGHLNQLVMVPVNEAMKTRGEIEKIRADLGLDIKEGTHQAPGRFYPIFITSSSTGLDSQDKILKAAKRLKELTKHSAALATQQATGAGSLGILPQEQQQQDGIHPPTLASISRNHSEGGGNSSNSSSSSNNSSMSAIHSHVFSNNAHAGHGLIKGANVAAGVNNNNIGGAMGTGLALGQVVSAASGMGMMGGAGVATPTVTPGLGTTMVWSSLPPPLQYSISILRQYLDLKPVGLEHGGTDFFQQWSLAMYATRDDSVRVRGSLALAFQMNDDLMNEAEKLAAPMGYTAKDYVELVRTDITLMGSKLEIAAAASFHNALIRVYDADTNMDYTFSSNQAIPPSREVSLLHHAQFYWLLEKASPPMPMEMTHDEEQQQQQQQQHIGGGLEEDHHDFSDL